MAKKKNPAHEPMRKLVEEMLGEMQRSAREMAALAAFRRNATWLRNALDEGGEVAAAAVIAFHFCGTGTRAVLRTDSDAIIEHSQRALKEMKQKDSESQARKGHKGGKAPRKGVKQRQDRVKQLADIHRNLRGPALLDKLMTEATLKPHLTRKDKLTGKDKPLKNPRRRIRACLKDLNRW